MARETKAQRTQRIALLLASYDAHNRELNKLKKIVEGEKAQIKSEVEAGTYGDWIRSHGTPREVVDMAAVKEHYAAIGEEMPTKMTDAPVVVSPRAGAK